MEFTCLFSFGKKPHQISDIAAISAAKHQHLSKSLKTKFQPLKELKKDTHHKDVESLFGETKTPSPLGKKRKIFQSCENCLGAKRIKQEKYEALNKTLKKWLIILRIENELISGSMLKEKILECTYELNIEGFQAPEG